MFVFQIPSYNKTCWFTCGIGITFVFFMKIVLQKCGKRESGEELWKGNTMMHLLSFFNFERAHYRL